MEPAAAQRPLRIELGSADGAARGESGDALAAIRAYVGTLAKHDRKRSGEGLEDPEGAGSPTC